MITRSLAVFALSALLLGGCAATLTLRNERAGAVKDIEVKVGPQSYKVAELAPGAESVQKLKVKEGGDVNVNYTDELGHLNYTSAREKAAKGDSRKWLLRLTPKTLMESEILK